METITPTELAKAAEISVPYAWQIVNGKRPPSLEMAIRIFDKTGIQFGALEGLTADEIAAARKMVRP
jgi:transcriptional regulator with XRE-family HTH domain